MTADDGSRALAEKFRSRLESELTELEALVESAAGDAAPVQLDQQSVGRLARMDAMQVQAMAQEAERRRNARKLRIKQALEKIEAGEFGICTVCGEEIPARRLEVDPSFPVCVRCADAAQR